MTSSMRVTDVPCALVCPPLTVVSSVLMEGPGLSSTVPRSRFALSRETVMAKETRALSAFALQGISLTMYVS